MLSQDLNSQSRSFSTTLPNVLNKGTTTFSPISITHSPLIYSLRSDHYLSILLVPEKKKNVKDDWGGGEVLLFSH